MLQNAGSSRAGKITNVYGMHRNKKGDGKGHSITGHEGPDGEYR